MFDQLLKYAQLILWRKNNDSDDELLVHHKGGGCAGGTMQLLLFMGTRISLVVKPLADLRRTFSLLSSRTFFPLLFVKERKCKI